VALHVYSASTLYRCELHKDSALGGPTAVRLVRECQEAMRDVVLGVHDGFQGTASWAGFLPGSDHIILNTHPYFAFDGAKNDPPVATGMEIVGSQPEAGDGVVAGGIWPMQVCSARGPAFNTSCLSFISVSLLPFGLRHGVAK
jgi:hypothetical protein